MFHLTPRNKRIRAASAVPFAVFRNFGDVLDRFFDTAPFAARSGSAWGGKVRETEAEIFVSLDAPGFEASEFEIQILEDVLAIRAKHVVKEGEEEHTERSFGRQITLPTAVDAAKVEAKYRNGVLELRLPKAEQAQWRKVEVKE